jgi:hypothetical protein
LLKEVGSFGFFGDDIDTSLAALQDKEYHDHLISQLKARGGSLTDPWLQIFLKAEHSDFINNIVMAFSRDNKHYLMGATCFEFHIQGTVWIHPIIVLNQKYKIIALRTLEYDSFPSSIYDCRTFSVPRGRY